VKGFHDGNHLLFGDETLVSATPRELGFHGRKVAYIQGTQMQGVVGSHAFSARLMLGSP
jgi:hypothetical protein